MRAFIGADYSILFYNNVRVKGLEVVTHVSTENINLKFPETFEMQGDIGRTWVVKASSRALVAKTARSRCSVSINDCKGDRRFTPLYDEYIAENTKSIDSSSGTRTMLTLPVVDGQGFMTGVQVFGKAAMVPFHPYEVAQLEDFMDLLVIVLNRHHKAEGRAEHMKTRVQEITEAVADLGEIEGVNDKGMGSRKAIAAARPKPESIPRMPIHGSTLLDELKRQEKNEEERRALESKARESIGADPRQEPDNHVNDNDAAADDDDDDDEFDDGDDVRNNEVSSS
jgi:hypothetical protein